MRNVRISTGKSLLTANLALIMSALLGLESAASACSSFVPNPDKLHDCDANASNLAWPMPDKVPGCADFSSGGYFYKNEDACDGSSPGSYNSTGCSYNLAGCGMAETTGKCQYQWSFSAMSSNFGRAEELYCDYTDPNDGQACTGDWTRHCWANGDKCQWVAVSGTPHLQAPPPPPTPGPQPNIDLGHDMPPPLVSEPKDFQPPTNMDQWNHALPNGVKDLQNAMAIEAGSATLAATAGTRMSTSNKSDNENGKTASHASGNDSLKVGGNGHFGNGTGSSADGGAGGDGRTPAGALSGNFGNGAGDGSDDPNANSATNAATAGNGSQTYASGDGGLESAGGRGSGRSRESRNGVSTTGDAVTELDSSHYGINGTTGPGSGEGGTASSGGTKGSKSIFFFISRGYTKAEKSYIR